MSEISLTMVSSSDGDVSTTIRPVPDSYSDVSTTISPAIPTFEGKDVHATKAKITSVSALDIGDRVFRLDESLKLLVEVTVDSISHKVNDKSGFLERIHTLKAIDTVVVDWAVDMDALREFLPAND